MKCPYCDIAFSYRASVDNNVFEEAAIYEKNENRYLVVTANHYQN